MPALYGATFIFSVEIIFLRLYGDIFTEFPLPVLSEHSRHAGTWTSLGEEERTTLPSAILILCDAASDSTPSFALTFLQSPIF